MANTFEKEMQYLTPIGMIHKVSNKDYQVIGYAPNVPEEDNRWDADFSAMYGVFRPNAYRIHVREINGTKEFVIPVDSVGRIGGACFSPTRYCTSVEDRKTKEGVIAEQHYYFEDEYLARNKFQELLNQSLNEGMFKDVPFRRTIHFDDKKVTRGGCGAKISLSIEGFHRDLNLSCWGILGSQS